MIERVGISTLKLKMSIGSGALALSQLVGTPLHAEEASALAPEVVVSSSRVRSENPSATRLGADDLTSPPLVTRDTARLLQDIPGVSLSGAGGISSLPVMQGLADDRNRISIDGMDLISSCGNHMNPPLSYLDPDSVDSIEAYTGAIPVSVGGDSIGGSLVVRSAPPRFADSAEQPLVTGELGTFYRSNGNARGVSASATLASRRVSLGYRGSASESDNYEAGSDFKPDALAQWTVGDDHTIEGDEVGSSSYRLHSHALGIAVRGQGRLLSLDAAVQKVSDQGFPSQHMDMMDNESRRFNAAYSQEFGWGTVDGRVYHEATDHEMDFGEDKLYWYGMAHNVAGMPMFTRGRTFGAALDARIGLNPRDTLRAGTEYQRYRLDDYWPAVANSMMMSPNTFRNIDDGQRDRIDVYAEWEAQWRPAWASVAGVRSSTVRMDAGEVQGYNANPMMYGNDAAAFNAADRDVTDHNIDLSFIARFTPGPRHAFEAGYARKTRSPSLYERYTWSTDGMAMTMNNWLNDGNGYVGDISLNPEVAHTFSVAADLHDAERKAWQFKAMAYYTRVNDYIDARCLNVCLPSQFNYLKLVNTDARLYGIDLSGFAPLGRIQGIGAFTGRAVVSYVDGEDTDSGDGLYNIMPLNARLIVEHRLAAWTSSAELVLVRAKKDGSNVRNEIETGGYGLLHLRTRYTVKHLRIDLGIDNVFDKFYAHPLGGAYIGQGATMSLNGAGAPYGIAVPGMGRSMYVALTLGF